MLNAYAKDEFLRCAKPYERTQERRDYRKRIMRFKALKKKIAFMYSFLMLMNLFQQKPPKASFFNEFKLFQNPKISFHFVRVGPDVFNGRLTHPSQIFMSQL